MLLAEQLSPWIETRFSRASGPGGQNVNKVNTRAELLFDFASCALLTDEQRARIRTRLAARLASDGRLRVVSQAARTQSDNRRIALARLHALLITALHERKARKPTRPSGASVRRHAAEKRARSETKRLRRAPRPD